MADENKIPSKSILLSKTLWVQVLTVVMALVPAVQQWFAKNPVEVLAVFAAINTLVRFATSGKVTIFPEDGDDSGSNSSAGTGVSGGKAGSGRDAAADAVSKERHTSGLPWLVGPACVVLLLTGCLVSCMVRGDGDGWTLSTDPKAIDAGLKYLIRHEEDEDAKSGPTTWEYYDAATGALIQPKDYPAYGIKP